MILYNTFVNLQKKKNDDFAAYIPHSACEASEIDTPIKDEKWSGRFVERM